MTLEAIKHLVADLHRPAALLFIAGSTAQAIWTHADPAVIAAAGGVLVVMFGARSLENYGQVREQTKQAQTGS